MKRDSNRVIKRQLARERRAKRRDLVHAAGCVSCGCRVRATVRETPLIFLCIANDYGVTATRTLKRWAKEARR